MEHSWLARDRVGQDDWDIKLESQGKSQAARKRSGNLSRPMVCIRTDAPNR